MAESKRLYRFWMQRQRHDAAGSRRFPMFPTGFELQDDGSQWSRLPHATRALGRVREIQQLINQRMLREFARRSKRLLHASNLVERSGSVSRDGDPNEPTLDPRIMQIAREHLRTSRARRWPPLLAPANDDDRERGLEGWRCYARISHVVLREVLFAKPCGLCASRSSRDGVQADPACTACAGAGTLAAADLQRADWLGVGESSYRASWKRVYEWVYEITSPRKI
jgi:hypothetical protein